MSDDTVIRVLPLGFPWETADPFLFCVHHDDAYPAGNEQMGPAASLAGRNIGQDFAAKDGWNMYHGDIVPGFPQHPHRGFETVTIVRRGFIDHSDSLGAAARFGGGDTQWLTAGGGVVHSEMFPLRDRERPNPLELFQIWLNLPSKDKLVAPHFTMLWNEDVPTRSFADANGVSTSVRVIAGRLGDATPPAPPPRSWASNVDADVAIWTIAMPAHARWTLPRARGAELNRSLYVFRGTGVTIAGRAVRNRHRADVRSERDAEIVNGAEPSEILVLQGKPISEPVVQHGPFVMNSASEIQQAFSDYRRTQFGGWPWPSDAPVHPRERGRFARHVDGRIEDR